MGEPKTSIIIPTRNVLELLKECIRSIAEHTPVPHEIIVVDSGSDDGTVDYCRNEKLTFVALSEHMGFTAACNYGMKVAVGDVLLLLNNDITVTVNWLSNMLHCLYSDDRIGVVGPCANDASGVQRLELDYDAVEQFHQLARERNQPNPELWKQTKRLAGFCFMFKREVMEQIGELDERFSPGHYEDDDYCYRARKKGFKLMLAGDVIVHRRGSMSLSEPDQVQVGQWSERNHKKFIDKWGFDPHKYIEV